jgi:hypothetical protein
MKTSFNPNRFASRVESFPVRGRRNSQPVNCFHRGVERRVNTDT